MTDVAVLVPVLNRPHRAAPLVESLLTNSTAEVEVVFLISPGDTEQMLACERLLGPNVRALITPFDLASGDYARKINYGVTVTRQPWVLQAADDLLFHAGWDEAALQLGEREHVGVIGTNDLGNPNTRAGRHATHSLIRRSYVEERGTIDQPGLALHEGYHHCWVDNELVETAVSRRAWVSARRSLVEHMHPIWRKGPRSTDRKGEDDATYRRGQERYRQDHDLFRRRRPLWRTSAR